jgi:hypothetical protein
MKDLGWLLLAGGGLFVLYEMGFFGGTTTTTSTPVGTSTSPQGADNATSGQGGTVNQTTTSLPGLTDVISLMKEYGQDPTVNQYSVYQYSYYYNMLSPNNPVPANIPAMEALGSANVPISQWWQALGTAVSGLSGLGRIAFGVNPYLLGPGHVSQQFVGAGLAPTGIETYVKYLGQG